MLERSPAILLVLCLAVTVFAVEAGGSDGLLASMNVPAAFSYEITASLDGVAWTIEGREKVTCFNRTARAVDELIFILDGNRYANSRILDEAGLEMPRESDPEAILHLLGYMDILEVTLEGGASLPEAPVIDGMLMIVSLPETLEPGGSAALDIQFVTKLPSRTVAEGGVLGRHVVADRWYPRLAALTEQGWMLPERGAADFCFGGFGDFSVTLTLDSGYTVDAAGVLKESHEENERRRVRYESRGAHDFTWTADPAYVEEKNIYHDVEIVILAQPFMREKLPRVMEAAKSGLDYFNQNLVPYPYERLVISAAPFGVQGTLSGPMFISLVQGFPTHARFLIDNTHSPESELLDGMARQVFCGLLACPDEGEAWLGESLATFLRLNMGDTAGVPAKDRRAVDFLEEKIFFHLLDDGFGLYAADPGNAPEGLCCGAVRPYLHQVNLNSLLGYTCSPFHPAGPATLLGYRTESMDPAWSAEQKIAAVKGKFLEVSDPRGLCYSETEQARRYGRAVLSLITLKKSMEAGTMDEILKAFTTRFMHQSPGLDDFLAVVQEKAGGDCASLAEFLFKDQGMVDYAVESARCEVVSEARGYITQHKVSDKIEENCTLPEGEASSGCTPHPWSNLIRFGKACDQESGSPPEGESAVYRWEVIVGNRGDMALPVSIRLAFEGGRTEVKLWDGRGGLLHLSGEGTDRLVSAEVDPDGIYAVDINRLNNGRSVKFNDRGVLFLAGWTQFWIQNYLNGWAFLN